MAQRCLGCMRMKMQQPICEHCGFDERSENSNHQLPLGTEIGQQYILGKVLGQGGFGITYLGWDKIMQTPVAVKEYFPSGYAGRDTRNPTFVTSYDNKNSNAFASNKQRFLREAESLSKLWDIPQIVKVLRHFEDNGTAYIAMEYVEGMDLRKYIKQRGRPLTVQETLALLGPVIQALGYVHKAELVHRDISPDNIMVLPDGATKLLDFGAARYVENANAEQDRNTSTQAIMKHGFAPPEQYSSHGALGPWTDVYAMCATLYYCLTGKIPTEAMQRIMEGREIDWSGIPGLTKRQLAALETGMALQPKNRLKSMEALYNELFAEILATKAKKKQEELAAQKPEAKALRRIEAGQLKQPQGKDAELLKAQQKKEAEARRLEAQEQKVQANKNAKARKRTETKKKFASSGNPSKLPLILAAAVALIAAVIGLSLLKPPAQAPVPITPETAPLLAVSEPTVTETEATPETTVETTPPLLIAETLESDGLELGYSRTIEVLSDHDAGKIQWSSANPEIATVSEDGTVTTVGYGNTTVTAEIDGQTASCRILVYPQANVDCKYIAYSSSVTVTGYNGTMPANAILPRYIEGLPVTSIGKEAFKGSGVKTMLLPESITSIGYGAFYECRNMSEINLPDSITSIDSLAFYQCDRLKSVIIPKGVTVIKATTFRGCEYLETVTLPENIQCIEADAFAWCEKLSGINFPEGLHTIERAAFFGCNSLNNVYLPDSLTLLDDEAFGSCESLAEIRIPDTLKTIGWLCFTDNPWMEVREEEFVIVGDGILVHYNGSDPHVVIPEGVKTFPSAFYKSTLIESVSIPRSAAEISKGAFYQCTKLSNINWHDSIVTIGDYAFSGCTGLTEVTLPDSVETLDYECFSDCTKLASIILSNSLTYINSSFDNCSALTEITIPEDIKTFWGDFEGCRKLQNIYLPESMRNRAITPPNSSCTITYY